ncbi:MAG: CinA family protein [Chryseoglobus sp.]|nr:CinA family protein [Microcella sp.]
MATVVADAAQQRGMRLACAESLTSGAIASALGRAPESAHWFCGGVIAYTADVKVGVLGVVPGPVVTTTCAMQMAVGVRDLMTADAAVAVTGVGGPGESEGRPAGTVIIAVSTAKGIDVATHCFEGDPGAVVAQTTLCALVSLRDVIER